jgi:hypothetical protein
MKQLLTITAIFFLFGCGEMFPCDGSFIVKGVEPYDKGRYKYHLVSVTTNQNSFYLKDSANKYIVGDTVYITKK